LPSSTSTVGFPFEELVEPAVPEQEPDHGVVHRQESERANQAAGERVVVADDRVLHGIRKREQHHQVERVQLRQFALAEDPQDDHQKKIHRHRTQGLLRHRRAQREDVVPHRVRNQPSGIVASSPIEIMLPI
jgi:hypothetical protein